MAERILKTKEIPEWTAKLGDNRRVHNRRKSLKGKKFEQLTQKEKDKLLKAVAIHLKLIDDSED